MTAFLFYLFHQKFTKTDHNIQLVLAHASLGHWSSLVLWSRDVAHEETAQGKHDEAEGELSEDVVEEKEEAQGDRSGEKGDAELHQAHSNCVSSASQVETQSKPKDGEDNTENLIEKISKIQTHLKLVGPLSNVSTSGTMFEEELKVCPITTGDSDEVNLSAWIQWICFRIQLKYFS